MPDILPRLPRLNSGDPIPAKLLNGQSEGIEANQVVGGTGFNAAGVFRSPAGTSITCPEQTPVVWARLVGVGAASGSGSAAPYSWQEILPSLGGKWSDGSRSGLSTDKYGAAFEINANNTITTGTPRSGSTDSSGGTIVDLRLNELTHCWDFSYDKCSSSS